MQPLGRTYPYKSLTVLFYGPDIIDRERTVFSPDILKTQCLCLKRKQKNGQQGCRYAPCHAVFIMESGFQTKYIIKVSQVFNLLNVKGG